MSSLCLAIPAIRINENQRAFGMPAYILDTMVAPRFGGPVPHQVYSYYYYPGPVQAAQYRSPVKQYPTERSKLAARNEFVHSVQPVTTYLSPEPAIISPERMTTTMVPSAIAEVTELPRISTTTMNVPISQGTPTASNRGPDGTHSPDQSASFSEKLEA